MHSLLYVVFLCDFIVFCLMHIFIQFVFSLLTLPRINKVYLSSLTVQAKHVWLHLHLLLTLGFGEICAKQKVTFNPLYLSDSN